MKDFKNITLLLFAAVLLSFEAVGQITYGSIEYEIRTNIDKRFSSPSQQGSYGGRRVKPKKTEADYLLEKAVLYFNDTASIFITEDTESLKDQNRTFQTFTLVNFETNKIETQINLLGEYFNIIDQQPLREWRFTSKERQIAGKFAKQAITKINDSTTIYAWFDTDFVPSIGPESYWDLPGAILGLAYEDGSVTYFATKINDAYPDLKAILPESKSRKTYTRIAFEKEFSNKYQPEDRFYNLVVDMLQFY